jgi:hypothetical protein
MNEAEERWGGPARQDGRTWQKSSRSFSEANCVEVSFGAQILVRDSKSVHAGGPNLTFSVASWKSFTKSIKAYG